MTPAKLIEDGPVDLQCDRYDCSYFAKSYGPYARLGDGDPHEWTAHTASDLTCHGCGREGELA